MPIKPADFPPGVRGISTLPAPASLFARLREVAPGVRRIRVIHSPDETWMIERATQDAAELGLGFEATRRDSLTEAAKAYLELIGRLHSTEDALWLPPRSRFAREESVLDAVIATAWKNNFIVFSSDADLTQRGVMLGVLPNYVEMGRALGELAMTGTGDADDVRLLKSLDLTINLKTANHLGLKIDANDARFKVVWGR
jgi:putative ABC transport system substrate-binding protein